MEKLVKRIKDYYPYMNTEKSTLNLLWDVYAFTKSFILLPPASKINLIISKKMKRKSGQFKYKLYKDGSHTLSILLSKKLLIDIPENGESLISTFLHEISHLSAFYQFLLNKQPLCTDHGYYFQKEMCILNLMYRGLRPIKVYHDYKIEYKYRVRCKSCKSIVRRVIHKGKLTDKSRHKKCGGQLYYEKI